MAASEAKIAPIFQNRTNMMQEPRSREALLAENANLKKEVASLKKENQSLKGELRKRKASETPSTAEGASAPPKKKAKTPAQCKKLFEKWAKAATRESAKIKLDNYSGNTPYTATVKETTPWTMDDFESIFATDDSPGKKIQPTPDNKPTSQITIYRFAGYDAVQKLFATAGNGATISEEGYKAQAWKRQNFCKPWRCGDYPAKLDGLQVQYNKSKCTLQLQFEFETGDCY